ncbi:MAG: response regulator transcription factor [bacterium]
MEVRSTPTASIAVVSEDTALIERIIGILRDETTQVVPHLLNADTDKDSPKLERPDIVVIDRAAPGDVWSRIRHLRRRWPTIELVVVNVTDEVDAGQLLDTGADDAILARSSLLAARLHAHARRARTVNAGTRIAVGDIVFDREARRVWCAGSEVEMTPRECAMLDCMFWHATRPVSVTTLADFVWGDADETDRRSAVEVYIGYIRKKLAASRSVVIRTVRQVGYQFDKRGQGE